MSWLKMQEHLKSFRNAEELCSCESVLEWKAICNTKTLMVVNSSMREPAILWSLGPSQKGKEIGCHQIVPSKI